MPKFHFPEDGILPKNETEASSFLRKYPEYDGRGVLIAILDTGVDPGAPGLQITSDGRPKLIDIIDCTGAGDVDTTASLKPETADDGSLFVTGLSGRRLTINKDWKNPSGEYRLGLKKVFDFIPREVATQVTAERKEVRELQNAKLITAAQQDLAAFDTAHTTLSEADMERRTELQARIDVLKDLWKTVEDLGPLLDCLVFHDGDTWRAVVDTTESGNLSSLPVLADYKVDRQHARLQFGGADDHFLNFCVNIYDDGDTLSLVTDCTSHGTHVAAIAAAYYPEDTTGEAHGLAPGAQLISLKIGDMRVGTEETGTGFTRAAIAIAQHKCDAANISFGEPVSVPNSGVTIQRLRDLLVQQEGVVVVSSAGNSGPCLGTVGAPGGTSNGILGVGAYVSTAMMEAGYGMLDKVPDMPFTWSSRGPTADGDYGPTIYAPGGAITSVPQWSLVPKELMNGTSMASPNACGNIALLLSALKAQGIQYTPYGIRRALVNTAISIDRQELRGLLQIDQAYEYMKKHHGFADMDCDLEVTVPERNARGLYLREYEETRRVLTTTARVKPLFKRRGENAKKLGLEMKLALTATAPWIKVAANLHLTSSGRDFALRVDPTGLSEGFHTAEILAYDVSTPARGPVFRLPVFVCKPSPPEASLSLPPMSFGPGQIERRFLSVPQGAFWATFQLSGKPGDGKSTLYVEGQQLVPNQVWKKDHFEFSYAVSASSSEIRPPQAFRVVPGVVLELCVAQYWSSLGSCSVSLDIQFHGLSPSSQDICIDGASPCTRILVKSELRQEILNPSCSLSSLRKRIRPSESTIKPLRSRDKLPTPVPCPALGPGPGSDPDSDPVAQPKQDAGSDSKTLSRQIYELILTYVVEQSEAASVTVKMPALNDYLYDSALDSVLLQVFDSNKKQLGMGDVYPKSFDLPKGKNTIRVQLRQESPEKLERLSSMPLYLETTIKTTNLDIYATPPSALIGQKSSWKQPLKVGESRAIYVSILDDPTSIKEAKPGDVLLGELVLDNGDTTKNAQAGSKFPIVYLVPAEPIKKEAPKATVPEDKDKDKEKALEEAVRDLKITWLAKLKDEPKAKMLEEMIAQEPGHVNLQVQRMRYWAAAKGEDASEKLVAAANAVLAAVGTACGGGLNDLAAFFALKVDPNDSKAVAKKKENEKLKEAVVEALFRKALTLPAGSDFEAAYAEFKKWGPETHDRRYIKLHLSQECTADRFGQALKLLNKAISDGADVSPDAGESSSPMTEKDLYVARMEVLKQAGWNLWEDLERTSMLVRFPTKFPAF